MAKHISQLKLLEGINKELLNKMWIQDRRLKLRNEMLDDYKNLTKKLFWHWNNAHIIGQGFLALGLIAGILTGIALAI